MIGYDQYSKIQNRIKNANDTSLNFKSGIGNIRFINRHIDKSVPGWERRNMIKIYDLDLFVLGEKGNLEHFVKVTDYEGGMYLNRLTGKPLDYITVNPEDPLHEVIAEIGENIMSVLYAPFFIWQDGHTLSDRENAAFVVDSVDEIANLATQTPYGEEVVIPTNIQRYKDCSVKFKDTLVYDLLKKYAWRARIGYIPIISGDVTDPKGRLPEEKSAWL